MPQCDTVPDGSCSQFSGVADGTWRTDLPKPSGCNGLPPSLPIWTVGRLLRGRAGPAADLHDLITVSDLDTALTRRPHMPLAGSSQRTDEPQNVTKMAHRRPTVSSIWLDQCGKDQPRHDNRWRSCVAEFGSMGSRRRRRRRRPATCVGMSPGYRPLDPPLALRVSGRRRAKPAEPGAGALPPTAQYPSTQLGTSATRQPLPVRP
jgi:hypothetical protein